MKDQKAKKVAFFDIDGTVFRSSLLVEVVEAMVREGIFPKEARDAYADEYLAWRDREGTYEAYIAAVINAFLENIKGVHYGTFADIGRQVVALHSKRVYRYSRDLLKTLKSSGYVTVAISQSPKTILDVFCANYGFDKVYGRIYEIGPQDRFTGEVTDEHLIENKANIVKRVLERNPDLTLIDSVAIGDTDGDIPLLDLVSRPICFNPNIVLFQMAQKRGWEVVVERKDVIYQI